MKLLAIFLIYLGAFVVNGLDDECDTLGILLYQDLGCTPVFKEGFKCPVEYKCDLEAKSSSCKFRGQDISFGDNVNDNQTYSACAVGCACRENNEFECDELDCPEDPASGEETCYLKFKLGECCNIGRHCVPENQRPFECIVDNYINIEYEKFYPDNTCLECVCSIGYEGKNIAPFCERRSCLAQIHNARDVLDNCAPYYEHTGPRHLCCPDAWVCPSSTDTKLSPNLDVQKNSDLTCRFGNETLKLGERLQAYAKVYTGVTKKTTCECILPPFLTCREVPFVRQS